MSTMASPPPPPPLEHSKKTHAEFPEKPSILQKIPSKSHSNSICKTLIVLVLILAIPFFPSQAPDFIGRTICVQFWEIIHLIFIGVAVSYGLFGRKSAQKIEASTIDDDLSGISHLSAIFEDGFGNACNGTDEQEQDLMRSYYDASCSCRFFGNPVLGQRRCVAHGGSISAKVRSFGSNNVRGEIVRDSIENNVEKNQTWSSKHSKGESVVVVDCGESMDLKPLNLTVRSLRSNVVDSVKSEHIAKIVAKRKTDVKVQKIRGVVPKNLEKRFEESDGLSPIPLRSRSVRMEDEEKEETEDEERNDIKPPTRCRPPSVGDSEFEVIKSRPSNKVLKFSTSADLETSRVWSTEVENVTSASLPEITPLTGVGDGSSEEDKEVGKGKQPIEPLEPSKKPLVFGKALSRRAKSVRTIIPRRYVVTTRTAENPLVNHFEAENPLVIRPNEEVDRQFSLPKPKPRLPDFFKEEKEVCRVEKNITEELEEDRESESRESESRESSDEEEDSKTNIDYDLGSEVDRKAGEFIAKFREQMIEDD